MTVHHTDQEGTSSSFLPRVSVIIPAYQAARHISEALESVFSQAFQDFEVIVINDGSPDTPQLEAALQPYVGRIRYLKQSNRGVSAARNFAIQQSCGELLAFLDSDDVWLPKYLETQVQFLDQNPTAVAAIADFIRFGESMENPDVRRMLGPGVNQLLNFEQMLRREAGQLPSATVVRRVKAIEVGLFDEQLSSVGEDIEFCIRLCFTGAIGYTKQVLVKYRKHGAGVTAKYKARDRNRHEFESLSRLGKKLPLTVAQQSLLNQEIAALEAELAMIDAYEDLSSQAFGKAAEKLAQANAFYHDKRIVLIMRALRIFPRWTARYLLSRRKVARAAGGNV